MKSLLLDTGPAVAFLDRTDPEHQWVRRRLSNFRGQLHTTTGVVTQVMRFVAPRRGGSALFAEFLRSTNAAVHAFSRPLETRAAVALTGQYWDSRMDYADATLLMLADRISVLNILTLGRRGFAFFRVPSGRALEILEPRA